MVLGISLGIAQEGEEQLPAEVLKMSLEDLMSLEVTTVSRKAEKMSDAAAAVFVITQEDIRRSGVTSIPEALRMAPGLEVARIDANKWAVTARGFNGRFANKLLVLIDGRTVYDQTFSGVWWDAQDTLLEDIDRIEVIRGPGATLWGANAVNGVINIITKSSWDTQGGLLTGSLGMEDRVISGGRFGGKIGKKGAYRLYAKYSDRDKSVDDRGDNAHDNWDAIRAGFRTDWAFADSDRLTFQGDIYDENLGNEAEFTSFDPPFFQTQEETLPARGGNLLGRWQHVFSNTSDMALQLYYDRIDRKELVGKEERDTFDIDFQHRFALGSRQDILWGFGYRYTDDELSGKFPVDFNPESDDFNLVSGFVQDTIAVMENQLYVTLGSKFEHNSYTGFEIQPNARMLWTPDEEHTFWGSVSRAVRTPSRAEEDTIFAKQVVPPGIPENPGPLASAITVFGNDNVDAEELFAYEAGYRMKATDRLSLDLAIYYNKYDNLLVTKWGTPFAVLSATPPYAVVPLYFENAADGHTYGVEVAADWRPLDWWRMQLAYTYLKMSLDYDDEALDTGQEDDSPANQFSARSSMTLPWNLELDLWMRYIDNLEDPDVSSYTTLDARLGWKPLSNLEICIVGQDLLDPQHPEFVDSWLGYQPTQVERRGYGKITWRF
jgi:iron complex outermembrane receptor protein